MTYHNTYLAHHGIKGQRWGVRRYQNPERVNKYQNAEYKQFMDTNKHAQAGHALAKKYGLYNTDALAKDNKLAYDTMTKNAGNAAKPQQQTTQKESKGLSDGQKTALKIGAVAAGTALAAYGGYKLSQHMKTTAGKKAYDDGFKKVQETLFKMNSEFKGDTPEFTAARKAALSKQMVEQDIQAIRDEKRASSSTLAAAKYLHNNGGLRNYAKDTARDAFEKMPLKRRRVF